MRTLLDAAGALLGRGEAGDAERQAKAVTALVRAERDVAEFTAIQDAHRAEHDDEALRAELRRRLALFAEADRADAPLEVLERIAVEGRA
jgi:hypothetical protein